MGKMNYIINPSWFYWLNVIDTVRGFLWPTWVISLCAIIIAAIAIVINKWLIDETSWKATIDENKKHLKMWTHILIPSIATFSICTIALIFIPAKDTLVEMMIAEYATYENMELSVDAIKSAVDYIEQSTSQIIG